MTFNAENPANDLNAQVVKLAMADPTFRTALVANPKAALAEKGLALPAEVYITALEETANSFYLVLPPAHPTLPASGSELSDAELENVVGGTILSDMDTNNHAWTGCASGASGCVASKGCSVALTATLMASSVGLIPTSILVTIDASQRK